MEFGEIDIRRTPGAVRELQRLGVMVTPALVIGDQTIVGFDRGRIDQALSVNAG